MPGLAEAVEQGAGGDGLNGLAQAHFVGEEGAFGKGQMEHAFPLVREERHGGFVGRPFAALDAEFVRAPEALALGGTALTLALCALAVFFVAIGLALPLGPEAGLWLTFYNSPSKHRALSAREREYILAGQEAHLAGVGRPSIGMVLRQRNFWGIAIPRFLADPTWGMLASWLPLYLTTVRGFDLKQIAMFAWLPFLAADLGCMFGGTISITLQKYGGVGLINARRCAFTVGAVMMLGVAFVGTVDNPYVAIGLLSLAGFAHQTLSVTVITMASDLFKRNEVATVAGMAGTCGNAGVLIFSLVIGALVTTVGYEPFFVGLAALDVLGAVVLWTVVRERRPEAVPSVT